MISSTTLNSAKKCVAKTKINTNVPVSKSNSLNKQI